MLTLIKRALAAAIVIAAVAAPTAAYARPVNPAVGLHLFGGTSVPVGYGGTSVPVEPPYTTGDLDSGQPVATSSSGFQWGDAGIGAGTLLVLMSVGAGAAVAYRRRAQRPLAS
jgi:hypothetical protein